MLLTNQRLDKLVACHADFKVRGMLAGSCAAPMQNNNPEYLRDLLLGTLMMVILIPRVQSQVVLTKKKGEINVQK
jgi:hypothetical protein